MPQHIKRTPAPTSLFLWIGALVIATPAPGAHAGISLVDTSPKAETFDVFTGTSASMPADWVVAGPSFTGNTLTCGSSAYNLANGVYALNDDQTLADRALGARVPNGTSMTLTAAYTNNTGSALSGFILTYAIEQSSTADTLTTNTIALSRGSDGTSTDTIGLSGDLATTALTAGGGGVVLEDPLVTSRSASYAGVIAAGETFYVRFAWTTSGIGYRPHWGVDDVVLTPVPLPEPGLVSLAGVCAAGWMLGRRARGR